MLNKKDIELIVYDFDGVMTDNRVLVLEDGREGVVVNRSDGLGVNIIKQMGIQQIILSTEINPVVTARARKIGIPVFQGINDKVATLVSYCEELKMNLTKVAYVGNDINDLECMKLVGWPIAPADAYSEVKNIAKIVTKASGGFGVVREIAGILGGNED
jgi:YrbI family 3-deoxy-D-manno-octulosonate 8-phosphate phosphatase